jgi:CCR4-NOT transcriptional complex subunit CAF120
MYQQERPRNVSMYSAGPDSEYPRSGSPAAPHRDPQPVQTAPQPPSARQTVWNANFSADHGMDQPKSGKFVDLDEPSAQLTKAFAPHGLLQAGMQDKEERSAKKQEELAREMGSSLINVPSKPPPPQTGLLGAVAAHERDRKNAGGIGATLTDREREKRFAVSRYACYRVSQLTCRRRDNVRLKSCSDSKWSTCPGMEAIWVNRDKAATVNTVDTVCHL